MHPSGVQGSPATVVPVVRVKNTRTTG